MKLSDVIAAYLTDCIPGLYFIENKGPVKLIKRVKIAHSFLVPRYHFKLVVQRILVKIAVNVVKASKLVQMKLIT